MPASTEHYKRILRKILNTPEMLPKSVTTRIFLKFEPEAAEMKPCYYKRIFSFLMIIPSLSNSAF